MNRYLRASSRRLQEMMGRITVPAFHRLYYDTRIWERTFWLGVPAQKCPLDLWMYQEIVFEIRPDLIIETGTAYGGSALFLASVCETLGHGHVIAIDIKAGSGRPQHPRIEYLLGSSTSPDILAFVQKRIHPSDKVLVILDSDHSQKHVLAEMQLYAPLVTPGSYLIVEDTNINGHPVAIDFGPGPMEAVRAFLRTRPPFTIDKSKEKFLLTQNPNGYLKRTG